MDPSERRFRDEDFEPPLRVPPIKSPSSPPPKSSLWGIFLAGVGALMAACLLGFLMSPLGPVALAAVALVFVLAALAAFHYIVWGWWLGDAIREDVEAQEQAEAEQERQRKYYERGENP